MALPSPLSMLSPVGALSAKHPRAAGYRVSDFVRWHLTHIPDCPVSDYCCHAHYMRPSGARDAMLRGTNHVAVGGRTNAPNESYRRTLITEGLAASFRDVGYPLTQGII